MIRWLQVTSRPPRSSGSADHADPAESPTRERIFALYELWYTLVDFAAAISFLIGSVLCLNEATRSIGTYFFLVGSVFFVMKPAIRLLREARRAALGDTETLARRAGWKGSSRRQRDPAWRNNR